MRKLNIIWITIDGARPHRKYNDPSDRPEIFDLVSKECVEFTDVIASAPSTIMSVGAMMASYPSFYLSRTYYSFYFDSNYFDSLPSILIEKDYQIYHSLSAFEDIKFLTSLFKSDCQEFRPKSINYYKRYWSVSEADKTTFNILNKIKQPFFFYVHYPNHSNVTQYVVKLIQKLKKENLYDNSIVIFTSDHGISPKAHEQKDFGILKGHDIDMDNGALYVPLLIKFPNSPIKKINEQISALDITPTILDILGIEPSKFNFKGRSLMPLIEEERSFSKKRFIRSDNRYIFQPSRVTSLINQNFKYIYNYETKKEWLYNIRNDPFEKDNLINKKTPYIEDKLNSFKKEFKLQENEALQFHKSYLKLKFKNLIEGLIIHKIHNVCIPPEGSSLFIDVLKESVKESIPSVKINDMKNDFDLAIVPIINESGIGYKKILKKLKKAKIKKIIYTDYNLNPRKKPNLIRYIYQHWVNNHKFYLQNPKAFITWVARIFIKSLKKKDIHKSLK